MREALLFIPPLSVSPATAEVIGGPRAVFDELRPRFELDVFTWPCIKGGADVPPTWEAAAQLIREALSPGCHVIAAGDAVWVAFLAISKAGASVRSVTCGAPGIPDATLRALGDSSLAEALHFDLHDRAACSRAGRRIKHTGGDPAEGRP